MTLPITNTMFDTAADATSYAPSFAGASDTASPQGVCLRGSDLFVASCISSTTGDLKISRLRKNAAGSWVVQDSMRLNNFGHGIAFGVENQANGDQYDGNFLWIECHGRADSDGTVYGDQITRIKYVAGTTVAAGRTGSQPGALDGETVIHYTAVVQPGADLLVVRYIVIGSTLGQRPLGTYYQVFSLSALRDSNVLWPFQYGTPEPVITQPTGDGGPNQGWTFLNDTLYILSGTGNSDPRYAQHCRLTSVDLNGTRNNAAGYVKSNDHGSIFSSLVPREPEGITIYNPAGTADDLLIFGLRKDVSGAKQLQLCQMSGQVAV